jgi:hypothetical protein
METEMSDLTLRRITWDDGQPSLDPEDYSVREGDRDVGRIYHATGGARGSGYAWFVYGTSRSGFAATFDDAKAEWKKAHAALKIAPPGPTR